MLISRVYSTTHSHFALKFIGLLWLKEDKLSGEGSMSSLLTQSLDIGGLGTGKQQIRLSENIGSRRHLHTLHF